MNHILQPMPTLRAGNVLRLWAAVLFMTAAYCVLSQLAQNRGQVGLTVTLLWNVKVWAVWAAVSAALVTERGKAVLTMLWQRPVQRVALMVIVPTVAWMVELVASAAFIRIGWLDGEYSPAELLYRRLPLYATASGVLFYILQHMRMPLPVAPPEVPKEERFTVQTSRGAVDVPVRDIEVVVAAENYVELCLVDGKQYLHRATLSSMQANLSAAGLRRVHRSVIVNPRHIVESLSQYRLRLSSGRIVRVGRAYRTTLGGHTT